MILTRASEREREREKRRKEREKERSRRQANHVTCQPKREGEDWSNIPSPGPQPQDKKAWSSPVCRLGFSKFPRSSYIEGFDSKFGPSLNGCMSPVYGSLYSPCSLGLYFNQPSIASTYQSLPNTKHQTLLTRTTTSEEWLLCCGSICSFQLCSRETNTRNVREMRPVK